MTIHLTRHDELALLTLDRPDALNALSFALLHDLAAALDKLADSDARALLVTGAGERAFCAGADIKELIGRSLHAAREGAAFGQSTFSKLGALPIPSIALINGFAFGGGLELALACTFRLAAPDAAARPARDQARADPRLWRDPAPAAPGRRGARARADPDRPHGRRPRRHWRIGLVNRLVDGDLIEAGIGFAREMTGYSLPRPRLWRATPSVAGCRPPLREGLAIEADLTTLAFQTADAAEGMAAFLEKRKPVFRDG